MDTTISLRTLTIADLVEYRTIRLAALREGPDAFGAVHDREAAKPITHHAERLTSSIVMAAFADARIIGMIGLKQEGGMKDSHKAFIWGFYVEPAHRGCGIGSALLGEILGAASKIVEQVTLCVVEHKTAAIALYERAGFVRYGPEPRAHKTQSGYANEVLMVRFLQGSAPA